ncbi:hypothetical protein ACQJBY_006236 [Aegilops geniculata]
MVCAICHSHCESHNEQTFRVVIRDDYEALANIPCTARNRFNQMSGLSFKADGRRYVVDVYRGHETTHIGGDDWAKFKRDFDVGQGNVVVFDMTGRTTKAYVAGVKAEEEGGVAEEVIAVDKEEEVVNDDHGLEGGLAFVNTRGFVFDDGEFTMMELILTIQHLYIGPPFVHRLTPTNITGKLMAISHCLNLLKRGLVWRVGNGRSIRDAEHSMDVTTSRVRSASDTCDIYFTYIKVNRLLYTCSLDPFEDGILLDIPLVYMHRYCRNFIDDEEEFKCKRTSTPSKKGDRGGRGTPRHETPETSDHPGCPASYAPDARTKLQRARPLCPPRVPAPRPSCTRTPTTGCPAPHPGATPGARSSTPRRPRVPGPIRLCLRPLRVK